MPQKRFELKIIKTTGDHLQTASMANPGSAPDLPKGLFTKELEVALLNDEADLAVHSLKDLPTELPPGLELASVLKRADVRDVLLFRSDRAVAEKLKQTAKTQSEWRPGQKIMRGFRKTLTLGKLPQNAVIATSSTRRGAQLKALRPDLEIVPIRGNVGTRLRKLWEQPELDATVLAAAGLDRLKQIGRAHV